ncbi:CoA transferase [Sphingobium sp. Sx8-8]|uniref:CaiB/BaiF CoA transferase family protein n=1 Tax=Sphingobium sp. Sx8-8 TaxID=2933617 RepID=UPI001F595EB8|nr:CoA transferase [Sphingobium sp. Sx8-8]
MTAETKGALHGVRVLDMSRVLAAPWAGQVLADLGADVIKVERPGSGDDARTYGAPLQDGAGNPTQESAFHLSANRNKRSLSVELSKAEGQDIIRAIVPQMDVLIENFLPGTMQRFGLDYASLRRINPRLVYCSLTGYGQDGPYAARPGYDAVFQAQSGMMSITGLPDGVPGGGPMKTGPSLVDVSTGMVAAIGILAALSHRDRISGEGQHVDAALLDTAFAMQSHAVQQYLVTGRQQERLGTVGNGGHPSRVFEAADGPIYISAGMQQHYVKLCEVLNIPELSSDPRFATSQLRFDHREEWNLVAEPLIRSRPKRELLDALVAARVPAAIVNSYEEAFADPHVRHRGLEVTMPHPTAKGGTATMVASPLRLSDTPVAYRRHPPLLGEHNAELLSEFLGWSEERVTQAKARGAI